MRNKILLVLAVPLAAALVGAVPAPKKKAAAAPQKQESKEEKGKPNSIAGLVTDSADKPVSGMMVQAVPKNGAPEKVVTAYTDEKGKYELNNVQPDTYFVQTAKQGYEPVITKDIVMKANAANRMNIPGVYRIDKSLWNIPQCNANNNDQGYSLMMAQEYKPGVEAISSIKVRWSAKRIEIRSDNKGVPAATVLAAADNKPDANKAYPGTVTFAKPVKLEKGNSYWIVVYTNYRYCAFDKAAYKELGACFSGDGGKTWVNKVSVPGAPNGELPVQNTDFVTYY